MVVAKIGVDGFSVAGQKLLVGFLSLRLVHRLMLILLNLSTVFHFKVCTMTEITITLLDSASGRSESLPVPTSTTIHELIDWCKGLFGVSGNLKLFKDGASLTDGTLAAAGVGNGDLLAVQSVSASNGTSQSRAGAGNAGGLDFSNLLGGSPAPAAAPSNNGTLDFSSLLGSSSSSKSTPEPVYFDGMQIDDAMQYNPHPHAFCRLLLSKEHLQKELNYHNPLLAQKLIGQPLEKAVQIWREEMVKGGIQRAMHRTQNFHKEQEMKSRLDKNPDDTEAKEYFERKNAQKLIDEQHTQMMNEYPEAMGRVLMLYISAKINNHEIQAFCDSGAQSTIMSKKVARECNLLHLVDERYAGTAVGVGTSKILGRIHVVQLEIAGTYFPCTVTVMDDPPPGASEMPFLLGLDMMKRHLCTLDLEQSVLKFRLGPGRYLAAPFLHEKDLTQAQGGTRGFDADKANEDLLKLHAKHDESNDDMKD